MAEVVTVNEVLAAVPHAPPFRFIDEILELDDEHIVAAYRFPEDADYYRGHFPGNPIMPGVLMVEAMAQCGAVAVLSEEANRGKLALFAGIDDVRFKRLVRPGDELELVCELERLRGPVGRGKARASVDGELAVRGTLLFALTDMPE